MIEYFKHPFDAGFAKTMIERRGSVKKDQAYTKNRAAHDMARSSVNAGEDNQQNERRYA